MQKKQRRRIRIASNQLKLSTGEVLRQQVVEIQSGVVVKYYPLQEELPQTEWWSGLILLNQENDGTMTAYYNGKRIE